MDKPRWLNEQTLSKLMSTCNEERMRGSLTFRQFLEALQLDAKNPFLPHSLLQVLTNELGSATKDKDRYTWRSGSYDIAFFQYQGRDYVSVQSKTVSPDGVDAPKQARLFS